ncbi:GNAT family N-acetyltransferase [Brachybacterium sp. ACRRE]|uniref:GNAT family N-acetyltransferase n=1 Tax=Brachybacterium sp. ACRRE TaxID=2918184 RepID=UPI001EF24FAC|nr:GNAT family N-acetyltransferase [Brachybacterium sp. ACRRE]MCG7311111.1 N-acetyltransferase family protein [Brachybacterium sp. ACRRE]
MTSESGPARSTGKNAAHPGAPTGAEPGAQTGAEPGAQPWRIRSASAEDAAACAEIYAHYVRTTAITFETEPPDTAQMARRIESARERYVWLVLEEEGRVTGYAYAGAFNPREAYRFTCEVSVYLASDQRGSGRGRALYEALLPALRERGLRRAIALVAQPNPASDRLHASFGFTPVGTFTKVGWKLGAWHDVAWSELDMAPDDDDIREPPPLR